ncbi:hypothetical protein [Streptomyces sp. NPDC006739]|uniref:hypothetical protein n=1 Tax=Streptomyces sp. NPDC006739 TaxID=3364763 RepID=UPI0036A913C8
MVPSPSAYAKTTRRRGAVGAGLLRAVQAVDLGAHPAVRDQRLEVEVLEGHAARSGRREESGEVFGQG